MAELNPGLILGYQGPQIATPQEQQYKKARLQEALNANDINRMKIDEYQAGKERSNALKNILATTDPNQLPNALLKGGFLDEASKYQKNQTDNQSALAGIEKTKFETQKEKTRAIGQAMGFLKDNPSLENLQATLSGLVNQGYMTPEQAQQAIQNGPQDPQGIATLATRHFQSALDADKQLAKYETRNLGGTTQTTATNPVSGQISVVNSVPNTQSPDNLASNQRAAADAAASRAVQMRGQDLSNLRMGESNAIAREKLANSPAKPLPSTALKLQNEALDKLSIASNINHDLGAISSQIDSGKLSFGPLINLKNRALNLAGSSTEESRNFATFKSTLEKLRNDSLLLNTGVQTDGDAQRAWNELFENINDTEFVKKRLKEIQAINERGADLQKMQVDTIRSNYGAPEIDYSRYESQPAALGNGASGDFGSQALPSQDAIAAELARRRAKKGGR